MWATMLFGRACEIWTTRESCRSTPHDLSAAGHTRCEYLVFKIAVQQSRLLNQLDHLSRFGDVTGQRFLTGNSDQLPFSGFNRIADGLHVLHTLMIWATKPQAIN